MFSQTLFVFFEKSYAKSSYWGTQLVTEEKYNCILTKVPILPTNQEQHCITIGYRESCLRNFICMCERHFEESGGSWSGFRNSFFPRILQEWNQLPWWHRYRNPSHWGIHGQPWQWHWWPVSPIVVYCIASLSDCVVLNQFKGHLNRKDHSYHACMHKFHWATNSPLCEPSPAWKGSRRRSQALCLWKYEG